MIRDQFLLDIAPEIIIDNVTGGGGASCGIELAPGRHVDIAINHVPEAVTMHSLNHPQTEHHCESVWDMDPLDLVQGRPAGLAWFSPDCKPFSKAKGGKPRDKKIRGLTWVANSHDHLSPDEVGSRGPSTSQRSSLQFRGPRLGDRWRP